MEDFIFLSSRITAGYTIAMKLKDACSLEEKLTNLDSILKAETSLCQQNPSSQRYVFSSCHVWMGDLDHKEVWTPKNWCFQTVVLEKILKSPLDYNIKPVNPKWNQCWIFIGKIDVEAEALILWPLVVNSLLTGKDSGAGKNWKGRRRGWQKIS